LRILIIGGGGYLGGRLADYLIKETTHDIVIAKTVNINSESEIKEIYLDWNNLEVFFNEIENIDVLIYASGLGAKECVQDPIRAMEINAIRPLKILNGIKEKNIYFCYFSTIQVYSDNLEGSITENTALINCNPYASTHAITEKMIEWHIKSGEINGIVLRISNVYGYPLSQESSGWNLVLNEFCRSAYHRKIITIKSTGKQKKDFMAMSDFVKYVRFIIEKKPEQCVLNVGSGQSTSIKDAAECVRNNYKILTGVELPIEIIGSDLSEKESEGEYQYKTVVNIYSIKNKLIANQKNEEITKTLIYCSKFK